MDDLLWIFIAFVCGVFVATLGIDHNYLKISNVQKCADAGGSYEECFKQFAYGGEKTETEANQK